VNDPDLNRQRGDRATLEAELLAAGAEVRGTAFKCPMHDDRTASGSVFEADGVWRAKCHGCGWTGDLFDVEAHRRGLQVADVLREKATPPARKSAPGRKPSGEKQAAPPAEVFPDPEAIGRSFGKSLEDVYPYADPDTGRIDLVVVRYLPRDGGKKRFAQFRPCAGGFEKGAPPKPLPLFNRTRVRDADFVVVCEGEKKCKALQAVGATATTSPGGAGKAGDADWSPLAGKLAYLWPDNDPPDNAGERTGVRHMRQVAEILERLSPPADVRWIDPDALNLPPKGDAVEFLALYGGPDRLTAGDALDAVFRQASPLGPSRDLAERLADIAGGRWSAPDWPWPQLGTLTQALLPGSIVVGCGAPEAGKSFWGLQCAFHWHAAGVPSALFMLENDRPFHLQRLLAQLDGNGDLSNARWVRGHADAAQAAYARHRKALDGFAPWLWAAPDVQPTHAALLAWLAEVCGKGCRVAVIDPITAAAVSSKPWIADLEFLMAAKKMLRQHGASLVLVTHPDRGGKQVAGGTAFSRFAETVLWLEKCSPPARVRVSRAGGIGRTSANRIVRVTKARNGTGGGQRLAFTFEAGLRFAEQGLILEDEPA
jgi:hypothetical protein